MRYNLTSHVLVVLCALLAACSSSEGTNTNINTNTHTQSLDVGGGIATLEANNDRTLESGEVTNPDCANLTAAIKPSCSADIYVEWKICLVEKEGANEVVSRDLNFVEICATHRTDFQCVDNELEQGETTCSGQTYCSYKLPHVLMPFKCGWRIVEGKAYNVDGTLIPGLTVDKLASLGYELLPVQP